MSRSEYVANKEIKKVQVGYITGPVIRPEQKPVKMGDPSKPSTWAVV